MSPTTRAAMNMERGFPRVSGDEPHSLIGRYAQKAFSPRERG